MSICEDIRRGLARSGLETRQSADGRDLVLYLRGPLDLGLAYDLAAVWLAEWPPSRAYTFDLSNVSEVRGGGLVLLLMFSCRAARVGTEVHLRNCPPGLLLRLRRLQLQAAALGRTSAPRWPAVRHRRQTSRQARGLPAHPVTRRLRSPCAPVHRRRAAASGATCRCRPARSR